MKNKQRQQKIFFPACVCVCVCVWPLTLVFPILSFFRGSAFNFCMLALFRRCLLIRLRSFFYLERMAVILRVSIVLWDCVQALISVLFYFWNATVLGIPVSHPGGPRGKPLTRKGKWPVELQRYEITGIKFACDSQSHAVTDAEYPEFALTGESCGRQIWHQGGQYAIKPCTTKTFSASENPNSADVILRNQMINEWYVISGGLSSANSFLITGPGSVQKSQKNLKMVRAFVH